MRLHVCVCCTLNTNSKRFGIAQSTRKLDTRNAQHLTLLTLCSCRCYWCCCNFSRVNICICFAFALNMRTNASVWFWYLKIEWNCLWFSWKSPKIDADSFSFTSFSTKQFFFRSFSFHLLIVCFFCVCRCNAYITYIFGYVLTYWQWDWTKCNWIV